MPAALSLLILATFFVDPAGNNSADGSSTGPWATITHAVDSVPDSSTILVRPGLYNGAGDTNVGSDSVTVRRNVFLNWEGSTGANFVLIG